MERKLRSIDVVTFNVNSNDLLEAAMIITLKVIDILRDENICAIDKLSIDLSDEQLVKIYEGYAMGVADVVIAILEGTIKLQIEAAVE